MGSSDDDCTMVSDRNVINRRNVRADPHSAYRADRDFLILEVTSRVVAAAYQVLGLTSKTDRPKHVPIPDGIDQMSKLVKLQFLHKVAAKIVDELIVDEEMMDASIKTMISSQERKEMMDHMDIDKDGRFPCRFPDCSKSFKYNGKSRRKHELSHDSPVIVEAAPCNVTVHNLRLKIRQTVLTTFLVITLRFSRKVCTL